MATIKKGAEGQFIKISMKNTVLSWVCTPESPVHVEESGVQGQIVLDIWLGSMFKTTLDNMTYSLKTKITMILNHFSTSQWV